VGFFIVSINVNFKEYFLKEFFDGLKLSNGENEQVKSGLNTGKEHHKRLGRVMNIGNRKSFNFVAKSKSRPNKMLHPKIQRCQTIKKNIPLTEPEAIDIMKKYSLCTTHDEPKKAIKQTGVNLHMIKPKVYILSFQGEPNGNVKISQ
jgi:hypothetical protein